METTSLIIVTILVIVSLGVLAMPFLRRHSDATDNALAVQKARDELVTTYERVLATIRDLDEDHNTGKLQPEIYKQERAYWTEQGVRLLQQLEPDADQAMVVEQQSTKSQPSSQAQSPASDSVLDDAIEQAIAAYRQAQTNAS